VFCVLLFKNAGLKTTQVGLNMNKLSDWVVFDPTDGLNVCPTCWVIYLTQPLILKMTIWMA